MPQTTNLGKGPGPASDVLAWIVGWLGALLSMQGCVSRRAPEGAPNLARVIKASFGDAPAIVIKPCSFDVRIEEITAIRGGPLCPGEKGRMRFSITNFSREKLTIMTSLGLGKGYTGEFRSHQGTTSTGKVIRYALLSLTYRFLTENGQEVHTGTLEPPDSILVAPLETHSYVATLRAPSRAGTYRVQLILHNADIVRAANTWNGYFQRDPLYYLECSREGVKVEASR